jgi:hypothetical protein
MSPKIIDASGAAGLFIGGVVTGALLAALLRAIWLCRWTAAAYAVQPGETQAREGARRAQFIFLQDHIHKQEERFGEGEEVKRWMIAGIEQIRFQPEPEVQEDLESQNLRFLSSLRVPS